MLGSPGARERRIALLVDADNAPAAKIDLVLTEVARHGTANVRRAYGNWKSPHLKAWEAVLHTHAIRPIQQFAYSAGKNASDMAMVVDAMDLLYAGNLDAFAIVSSDADFTPLVMRILTEGLKVYGFGERKTPEPFVNACSQFVYVEGLAEPDDGTETEGGVAGERRRAAPPAGLLPVPRERLRADTRLVRLLRAAVDAAGGDEDWVHLAAVGQQIANQASLDPRNYGYRKLSDLVEATGLFDTRRAGQVVQVRRRAAVGGG